MEENNQAIIHAADRVGSVDAPSVAHIADGSAFENLRGSWNDLLHASASDCVFLTWEWLFTWWKHLSETRKLSLVAVHQNQRLIALAPLALRPAGLGGISPFRSLEFLGTGSVGSDYLDLIVERGKEREALRALATDMIGRKRALDLRQVKVGASLIEDLAGQLGQREGWGMVAQKTDVCPFIPLSGHTWPSYLAALGSQHRYNFQRRLKNLHKQFDVRFEPARTEAERAEALRILIALHHMRWGERGGSDGLHTPSLLSFHEEFSRLAFARGWLRLFVLRLDGKPAAALYGLRYGRVFYFFQSGFDAAYAKESVGLVTMGLAIKSALEEGAEEYDLLHGDEGYKFQWARETRDLARLTLYPAGALGRVHRRAAGLDRVMKRFARRILPKAIAGRIATARRTGAWKGLYAAQPR
jgi:CelD/BcsL family acetyltransferase involved in cellulose biosynthesis